MKTLFHNRVREWREKRGFTHSAAAGHLNSIRTGEPITAETLQKYETGIVPSSADRLLLEFFMTVMERPPDEKAA
jgi:hypothetical protein